MPACTSRHFSDVPSTAMHLTPSKPLFSITEPTPKSLVKKATAAVVSKRPKPTTEQALKGYD